MEHKDNQKVKRGEIYLYDFGNNEGSIQNGIRPVLIVQCDEGNQASTTTVVAALTTAIKKRFCHRISSWAEISDWMSLQWLCLNN